MKLSAVHVSFLVILMAAVFSFSGCKDQNPVEGSGSMKGYYVTAEFSEPGASDGGIDIQAGGGRMYLSFEGDKYTCDIYIPDTLNSNYPKGKTSYSGFYSFSDGRLILSGLPMCNEFTYNKEKHEISAGVSTRFGPINIRFVEFLRCGTGEGD